MIDPILDVNTALRIASASAREVPLVGDYVGRSMSAAVGVAKAQHERTLAWLRERLEAGEHLEDLLA